MKALDDCYLYGILDLGYIAERDAVSVAKQMLDGGVDILQLRAKRSSAAEVLALAKLLQPHVAEAGAPFIVNDHPLVVAGGYADGVHIGQDDGSIAAARFETGLGKLVGRSTHSLEQARAARDEGADYLGFGPLFATPTKPDYVPIGLDDIARVHSEIPDRPIFCIGGVKLENLREIIAAGAHRAVIVSGILQAGDIAGYVRKARAFLLS